MRLRPNWVRTFLLTTHQVDLDRWLLPRQVTHWIHRFKKGLIQRHLARHKLQVTSYGGAGTTMLCSYFARCKVGIPTISEGDWSPWKHMDHPPKNQSVGDEFRAIYVISDPREALLSVFRRGFQHWHIQRMNGDLKSWDYSWGLEAFLNNGVDLFGYRSHFLNWTQSTRKYPILIVKYEYLEKNKQSLLDFARVPKALQAKFPVITSRVSRFESEPAAVQERLGRIFEELMDDYNDFPEIAIIKEGCFVA